MNWKKNVNLFLSMILALSTMMSDVTVYAEGEEETEEPVIEEVTEIVAEEVAETEETEEPETAEIITEAREEFKDSENDQFVKERSENEEASFYAASDYEYTEDDEGITITKYNGSDTDIIIPAEINGKPVVRIGESAFAYLYDITTVVIPDSVTSIGSWAFNDCNSLTEITIPGSVKTIEEYTFCSCYDLKTVTIKEGVTSIKNGAFRGCGIESLTIPSTVSKLEGIPFIACDQLATIAVNSSNSVYDSRDNCNAIIESDSNTLLLGCKSTFIPNTVTSIGDYAFYQCKNLTNITIPDSVTKIGDCAFEQCSNLKTVGLSTVLTNLGYSAFSNCLSLTEITVPGSITEIGPNTFYNCKKLETATISEGVQSIGSQAFYCCNSLAVVNLPGSITSIDYAAFADCNSLSDVNYAGVATQWTTVMIKEGNEELLSAQLHFMETIPVESIVFNVNDGEIFVPVGGTKRIDFSTYPANASETLYWSSDNEAIATVDKNGIITGIALGSANITVRNEEGNVSATVQICVTESEKFPYEMLYSGYEEIGVKIIGYTGNETDVIIPAKINGYDVLELVNAFENNTNLVSVTLPPTLTKVGAAFSGCINLTTVNMPESFNNTNVLFDNAFRGCSSLTDIRVPEGVTSLRSSSFADCSALKTLSLPSTLTEIHWNVFNNCSSLTTVIMPDRLTTTGLTLTGFSGCKSLTSMTVPEGVTEIGEIAFYGCDSFESITLPSTLTKIGDRAFHYCRSLSSVQLPEGVTEIGVCAFSDCTGLKSVFLPDSLRIIGSAAFQECSKLESITIPEGIEELPDPKYTTYSGVFGNCTSLSTVTLPSTLNRIGNQAFIHCSSLKTVTMRDNSLNDGVSIGNSAFSDCENLESVNIPAGFTSVGNSAFGGCTKLLSVIIRKDVTNIGAGAFCGCGSLETVLMPETLLNEGLIIDDSTFSGCSSLTAINIPDGIASIGDSAFSDCSSLTSIIIPEGVTEIGESAFSNCTNLININLPEGVTNIGGYAFSACEGITEIVLPSTLKTIEIGLFRECTSLESINIPEGITELPDASWYGNGVFYECGNLMTVVLPSTLNKIGNYSFYKCSNLQTVTMREGLADNGVMVGDYAFYDLEKLTTITIPNGLTGAGEKAFYDCRNLSSAIKFKDVTKMGKSAFDGCNSLKTVQMPGKTSINEVAIEDYAFRDCSSLTAIELPKGIETIGEEAFLECTNLSSVYIPEGVTDIGGYAFNTCSSLKKVVIPEGITEIKNSTFSNCSSMTEIILPSSLTLFGKDVFLNCSSLQSIVIPEGVTELPKGGNINSGYKGFFSGCTSLQSVSLPSTLTKIDVATFSNCISLESISIPEGVTELPDGETYSMGFFYNCTNLVSVKLPSSLTKIGAYAFYNCSSLLNVDMPERLSEIGTTAFTNCSSLESITIPEGVLELPDSDVDVYGFFYNCTDLTSVSLPTTLTKIGSNSFYNCTRLESINIPEGVTVIEHGAFNSCNSLSSLTIPEGVTTLPYQMCYKCTNLKTVSLPSTLMLVDGFEYCENLISINIPEGATAIGSDAFRNCKNLTEVNIPSSITLIGENAFRGCEKYADILSFGATQSIVIGKYAFEGSGITKVYLYDNAEIGPNAFSNCHNLDTVAICNACFDKSEGNNMSSAFAGSEKIKKVYYSGSEEEFLSSGGERINLYRIIDDETKCHGEKLQYLKYTYGYYLGGYEVKEFIVNEATYNEENGCSYSQTSYSYPVDTKWDIAVNFNVDFSSLELETGGLSFGSETATLYHISATKNINANLTGDARGKKINFTSSDENVVAFDESALTPAGASWCTIIATGAGTATITATTEDGKYSASMKVTVLDTEEHFGFLSEIKYNESILVIDGEEHTFRNDDPNHLWPFQSFDNDHFNSYVKYYTVEGTIVDVDVVLFPQTVKNSIIWPKNGISNVYAGENSDEITIILQLSSDVELDSVNISNENLIIQGQHGTVNVETDKMIAECEKIMPDDGIVTIHVYDEDNILLPGERVSVTIGEDIFSYKAPEVLVEHGISKAKNIKTETTSWSFNIASYNFATDSSSFINSVESIPVETLKIPKEYMDRLYCYSANWQKDLNIKQHYNEKNEGVCYGIVLTQSLVSTGYISISDISDSGAKTYSELNPKDDTKFRDNLIYYYKLQQTGAFEYKDNSFVFAENENDLKAFLKTLVERLYEGKQIPLGIHVNDKNHHIVTAFGISWDYKNNKYVVLIDDNSTFVNSPVEMTINRDFSGYSLKMANIIKDGEKDIGIRDPFVKLYAEDIDMLASKVKEFTPTTPNPNAKVVIETNEYKYQFIDYSGVNCKIHDMLYLGTISHNDSTNHDFNFFSGFNPSGNFKIISEDNAFDMTVYTENCFFEFVIDNADYVEIVSENDPKLIISGDNYSFKLATNSIETNDGRLAGKSEFYGNAHGNVQLIRNDEMLMIDSDNEMTNVITKQISFDDDLINYSDVEFTLIESASGPFELDSKIIHLQKNEARSIKINTLPNDHLDSMILWTSNNEDVVEVNESGMIFAKGIGTCYVYATISNTNISQKVKVAVHPSDIHMMDIASQKYSGSLIKPNVSVYDGLNLLTPGIDYTVTYKNNVKAYTIKEGEAGFSAKKAPQVIIKAKGNYSGTKTVYFTIDPADITSSDVETLTTAYTGKVQKLSPTVAFEGKTLKKGTDYTLDYPAEGYTEPGTYEITVTGKGNYTGSRTYQMIIGSKDQINLSKATVSFDKKSYAYDGGNQIMPVITVKNGKTVIDPSLYTVSYGDNNTVGNGTVTITGNDSETIGTKTVTFKITGAPITKLIKVTVPKSVTRGTTLKDAVTIKTDLTEGTDYEVTYDETENAGKANIVITGINGYTGTIKKTVTVSKDKLTAANTTVSVPDTAMMKNGAKPAPTVTVNGTELTEGTDYTLSYANNKKAGTGTVTVKGKGNYAGSVKQTFMISTKDLSETTLVFANNVNSSTKKGSHKTTVVIRDEDGGVLKANTDYILKFYDGDTEIPAAATANDYLGKTLTVKASGKGNYTGEEVLSAEYKVVDSTKNLAKASISIKPQQYLSGKPVEITSQDQFKKAAMGKTPLTLGTDFEVYSYSNNTAKGTATVVFEGIGDYSGYKSVTYKIGQRSIKDYWSGVVSFFSRLMN